MVVKCQITFIVVDIYTLVKIRSNWVQANGTH